MLAEIVADVRRDLPSLRERESGFRAKAARQTPARDFLGALTAPGLSVIAEIKRASPSRGLIDADLDPVTTAAAYELGGAAAISVLTEPHHFHGSLDDLENVRAAVELPVLRKDFIVDPVQIWEARAAGADAVLLIVAALDDATLAGLLNESQEAGVEALVEAHDARELDRARSAGARLIGINNRDLESFEVDLTTAELVARTLTGVVSVAESGIWSAADARRMEASGYDAILVGESLVRAADPIRLLAELRGST
jgi:indole-3-glycerol phosphate synthase